MGWWRQKFWTVPGRKFQRDEEGSATVEACLWLPALFFFFILILDATFIFLRQSDAHRIVQDGTRQFVSGSFDSLAELEAWLESAVQPMAPSAIASATIDSATGILNATISYASEDTDLTGVTGMLGGLTIQVRSVQLTES